MKRSRILLAGLGVALSALVCAFAGAQTDQGVTSPEPVRLRKAERRPMPFPPGVETRGAAVEFRSYDRMSAQDRALAEDAESGISERAGFEGLEFNQGKWDERQIVCSALAGHLFLQFMRNNGTGDVSVFSASIPRDGNGRVRIIPILRRGYSLFSPAPINALTISAFNHIRAEEPPDESPGWLATGLCYAALAGANPQTAPPEETAVRKLPGAPPGRLFIPIEGGAVISFVDVSATPRPMQWTMTFNGKGKLLKATHRPAPRATEKTAQRKPVEVQGKPVRTTDPEGKAILIQ